MEDKKIDIYPLITALCVLCLIFGFGLGNRIAKRNYITIEKRDTVTIVQTIHDTAKLVQWRDRVRTDTLFFPVADTLHHTDTLAVPVQIEQKTYQTENYRAVVEGWHPELVSIDIYQKEKIVTIEKQIAPKKWTFGATIGVTGGAFYTPKGFQPGIGVGASIGATYHF